MVTGKVELSLEENVEIKGKLKYLQFIMFPLLPSGLTLSCASQVNLHVRVPLKLNNFRFDYSVI